MVEYGEVEDVAIKSTLIEISFVIEREQSKVEWVDVLGQQSGCRIKKGPMEKQLIGEKGARGTHLVTQEM